MPSANHLEQHQFKVQGAERLSAKPLSVRLYESDDIAVRAMGKQAAVFVREAVRLHLQRSQ